MSIYGPDNYESSDCAGCDSKVSFRVKKMGDVMSGDLQMGGNLVRGLPTSYPPTGYIGDEAPSWFQVVKLTEQAHKPIIAVWAEQGGPLTRGSYEWSFGNGSSGQSHAQMGFPMPVSGRAKAMALRIVPENAAARVALVINGTMIPESVTKETTQKTGVVHWESGYELAAGDHINFKTASLHGVRATSGIVSLLIELDM